MDNRMMQIGLGGGCHWCTEAVFQALQGVDHVHQGFIAADPPDDAFSEAVLVMFDNDVLPLQVLIEAHLRTHVSTSQHSLRGKYRSAIYVDGSKQEAEAALALNALQPAFDRPIITRILQRRAFRPSDSRFQNYYASDPERPFCKTYIDPKLALLRERFAVQ